MIRTTANTLPVLVYHGDEPYAGAFERPSYQPGFCKPRGGMWLSRRTADGGSEWASWCDENFAHHSMRKDRWIVTLAPGATVLVLESQEDADAFTACYYDVVVDAIRWDLVASVVDVISVPGWVRFPGLAVQKWDVDSVVVLTWSAVEGWLQR